MKQFFFIGVAVAVPVILAGILLYMFFHGIYTVIKDWRLRRELRQIERESAQRRQPPGGQVDGPSVEQTDAVP